MSDGAGFLPPEVERLHLQPGDKLVLKYKRKLTPQDWARIRAEVKQVISSQFPVIILDDGTEMAVIQERT